MKFLIGGPPKPANHYAEMARAAPEMGVKVSDDDYEFIDEVLLEGLVREE